MIIVGAFWCRRRLRRDDRFPNGIGDCKLPPLCRHRNDKIAQRRANSGGRLRPRQPLFLCPQGGPLKPPATKHRHIRLGPQITPQRVLQR